MQQSRSKHGQNGIGGNATDREPLNLLISPALLSPSTPSIAV
ncbi:Hypothetical protein RY69_1000 [Bifidobacterium breve]|nr:Hypothetical protein RY69_1000 [Bifidobacterium breve]